ncbi:hypothetical protein GCM10007420_02560 [Glycocaulis albus]|uniref:DUF433 domain-containing protein n=1 Tax=Glycocaulis albus TaxID=1382801 RepID=A0ABQ1XFS0_9PROT|nr:DUF433 domain-containing protein [Glycocaulis albus]GGG90871.1 hypothetical protein GCM10007420_02560 [Glycocaulis albus]
MTANLLERITTDPAVMGGQPCLRGLRIRVSDILGLLASGMSSEDVLADYTYLEADDIRAELAYAARLTGHRVIAAE